MKDNNRGPDAEKTATTEVSGRHDVGEGVAEYFEPLAEVVGSLRSDVTGAVEEFSHHDDRKVKNFKGTEYFEHRAEPLPGPDGKTYQAIVRCYESPSFDTIGGEQKLTSKWVPFKQHLVVRSPGGDGEEVTELKMGYW